MTFTAQQLPAARADRRATPPAPRRPDDNDVLQRHNAQFLGNESAAATLVFAHGFGCDQNVWRHLVPAFARDFRILLIDYAGCGLSAPGSYDRRRHASLAGHAEDVIAVCDAAGVRNPILVAHSVSAMIGALVDIARPGLLYGLVMVCPTPSFLNDGDYPGGFERDDIDDLLETLDSNYFNWARMMAPVIMGNLDQPELAEDLGNSFCRFDPEVAKHFARATFLSDHRADLPKVTVPTLVLQCQDDALASVAIGQYVVDSMPDARLALMKASGHCPHLSAPAETIDVMTPFVGERLAIAGR